MKKALYWVLGIVLFVVAVKYVGFSEAGNCKAMAEGIKGELRSLAQCQSDAECGYIRRECPFDCFTPIRRDKVAEAMAADKPYRQSCLMFCPECPEELPRVTRCSQGFCVVE